MATRASITVRRGEESWTVKLDLMKRENRSLALAVCEWVGTFTKDWPTEEIKLLWLYLSEQLQWRDEQDRGIANIVVELPARGGASA
jgi:hypothetical protein